VIDRHYVIIQGGWRINKWNVHELRRSSSRTVSETIRFDRCSGVWLLVMLNIWTLTHHHSLQ